MAGKAAHISGITARGDAFAVRLTAPAADLPARLAQPFFCAVPSDTPVDPGGVRVIPSARPYRVASYTPGQGVVLTRNPNYHGSRPHRLARIELAVGIPGRRSIGNVEAGRADYAMDGQVGAADAPRLAARYGARSPAAWNGRQRYFVNRYRQLDFFALNTHGPLFADARLRRAVNYAVDRTALASLGSGGSPLAGSPANHYLPPGMPGYTDTHIYPLRPELGKARRLAKGYAGARPVLYTCNIGPCQAQAQILKNNLAAIGLELEVKAVPTGVMFSRAIRPGEPFDIVYMPWVADYPDPAELLNLLLESGTVLPTFEDRDARARLAAAGRLTGEKRYLTYARLDAELTRRAAPWIAFGNASSHELFSARMGCQTYGVYGLDLAALCVRE